MLKKNVTYLVLFLVFGVKLFSQTYNNEWIVYQQSYYKIKIGKDGLYKIDSAALAAAGVPVGTLNPQNIQLFSKGKEIYPYIFGESDGVFNTNDYILFYAEKNTCKDDSLYFDNVPFLANPYYSVINDTAAVFLTWNSLTNNHRLTLNTDTAFSQSMPSPYYYKEVFTGKVNDKGIYVYNRGPLNSLGLPDPRYKLGEGFYNMEIYDTETDVFTVNTSAIYTAGPVAYFTFSFSGSNNIAGVNPDHFLTLSYSNNSGTPVQLKIDSVSAYDTHKFTFPINPASLGASTDLTCSSGTNSATTIRNTTMINFMSAYYPQQFNMLGAGEEKMRLPDDGSQTKSKLVISNFSGSNPFFINVTNSTLHTVKAAGSNFQVLVPNSGQTKLCYLADSTQINAVTKLTPVNGTGQFMDYTSQLADSNYLIVYHPKLDANGDVTNYKAYRSSMAGGGYPVLAAPVTDLYDQFGYGTDISPMAIRNFCAWVIADPRKNPSHLLLLGKGVHSMDCIAATTYSSKWQCQSNNLIPSWGEPAADALITHGLPGSLYLEPAIPTGRLAAQTPAQIASYLTKLVMFEQQTGDSLWKKRALHFIGGKDYYEQQSLTSYMSDYKRRFEDTLMGGHVFSFFKISTAPTSVATNDSIKTLIEQGVQVMTFFGHGSQTGFDQNIDDPQNYNNAPRFPLIIGNSCYTGDIHSNDQISNSEVFTLAPNNKGSIGFLATISEGVADRLYYYTDEFYKQFSSKSYGQSYGICMKNTVRNLLIGQANGSYGGDGDSLLKFTSMGMTFHGDPAIKPYNYTRPDYGLSNSDVIINTTQWPDSLSLKIIMTNYARAINDSFIVFIRRTFPNGDTVTMNLRVKAPRYQDTVSMIIPKDYYRAVGMNCFYVELDYLHMISEINELNNKTSGTVCLFIPGAAIEPVWPYKYAIVPNLSTVTLKASTADPFAPLTTYRFQVDTCDKFLTPYINTTVQAPGGVVNLPITLHNVDSMVYFWRVCKDDNDTLNWKNSSFQTLNGKYGWGQAHFNQFKNDVYQYVTYDSAARRFDFVNDIKSIEVTDIVVGPWQNWLNFEQVSFYYNNAQQRNWSCAPNGWTVAVFDSITGNLKYTDTSGQVCPVPGMWLGSNGNCVCQSFTRMAYDFGNASSCQDNPDWRTNMINFINDSIPVGAPVLAYTVKCWWCTPQDTVTTALINALKSIGSMKIDSLQDSTSLIIFGKKGMSPGQAHEVLSTYSNQLIDLKDTLRTRYKNGFIASEIIGPCMYTDSAWHSLHWNFQHLPGDFTPSKDSIVIRLMGITANGQKYPLVDFPADSLNVLDLSRYASGRHYPYLQLIAFEADLQNNTPPQLSRWQVIYDPAPEAALDPPAGFQVFKNPVAEGEDYKVRLPIRNVSDFPFNDSLVVTYTLEDASRVNHVLPYKLKKKPFLPDSVIYDTITVTTLGYAGNNTLWVDVNPPGHTKYQPEQYHFNNTTQLSFNANKDKINPLLDVTFDGVHILNGDIVSAKPNVLVSLKDENKFLALNDTSNFVVYVQLPGASTETRLFFKDALQFTPAQLPNNSCKINYKPMLGQDGMYTLHVIATDRSKNLSGQMDYKIQFEVVNKPTITEVLNYPNPFSTSTKFVFTITGSEVPETLKIQIMTITGRVVKEITREELGFLHIGRNITEYAWDGTDQFGDKLANGVYLYRVQSRLHGNEIDHLATEADSYFKKGYGKMLLMR